MIFHIKLQFMTIIEVVVDENSAEIVEMGRHNKRW